MNDLGDKHECPNCGTKYYDLGAPSPACPKCGTGPGGEPPAPEPEAKSDKAAADDDDEDEDGLLDDEE